MKIRFFRLTVAVVVALVGLVLFGSFAGAGLAASQDTLVGARDIVDNAETDATIRARRAISIPFGIDSPLALEQDGRQIRVTGHGTCQEGGETFKLRTSVTQETTHARAKGRTEGDCRDGAELRWTTEAEAQGPRLFEPGDAEVCAMAVVFVPQGGSVTQQWCKEVTLE